MAHFNVQENFVRYYCCSSLLFFFAYLFLFAYLIWLFVRRNRTHQTRENAICPLARVLVIPSIELVHGNGLWVQHVCAHCVMRS
jgi:hypothetical protein